MRRKRVVVAGLGDCGLLTAIQLAGHADVIGISAKPALVSGKELGTRISRPDDWARSYWIAFDRFRGLDRVRTVHGVLTGVDLDGNEVVVRGADGATSTVGYDALVISTGVANGFWRRPGLQSAREIGADLRAVHGRVAAAGSVAVVGGGPAAVGSAASLAARWPGKRVGLYFPGDRPLLSHHPRAWGRIRPRLAGLGVDLNPGHRAVVPAGFGCDRITAEPLQWSTGQPATTADVVLWAIGRVSPNTGWLPAELLDENGFVRVTPELRVPGLPGVFAVGDVAATDPLRCSARNRGYALVARNVRAEFDGKPLRSFKPPAWRWGSVLGVQPDGLEVFMLNGRAFRYPSWSIDRILEPLIQRRLIYHGVRDVSRFNDAPRPAPGCLGARWNHVRMTPERTDPPVEADERTTLTAFLDFQRATLARKCDGLSDDQLRERTVPPSSLSLLGLVRHMADVEHNWFRPVLGGEEMATIFGPDMDWEAAFRDVDTASVSVAFDTWQAECEHSRALVAAAQNLEAGGPRGSSGDKRFSLRWVLGHMIEEYARHNGHADLLRERLDGSTGT